MSDLSRITRPVRAVARRLRLQRAMNGAAVLGVAGLGVAGLLVALVKAGLLPAAEAPAWLLGSAALPVLGALIGALRPVRRLGAAQRLDRAHGLRSRIASALELSELPPSERTPFMDAAIADALEHAGGLEPKRAAPLRAPRDLVVCAGLALGVGLLAFLEVPERRAVAVAGHLEPLLLHPDDMDAFSGGLDGLVNDPDTPEDVRDAAREFNQLVEDMADRRLDRTEALRRITELERRIAEGRAAEAESLRDALRELGEQLRRSSLTQAASDALRDGDAARAERSMRELADRLRSDPPSRAELERLRQALERAAQEARTPEEIQRELERQREQMQRLLQREQKQGLGEREQRLLQRQRRDLERLEREQREAQERQRRLERLRRELDQAAQDLRREMPEQAADSLDQGAEDLNRMARQQMSEEQMQQMLEQLRQLRELMRRQRQQAQNGQGQGQQQGGQGGQGRMDRFVLRAQGQGDGEGIPLVMPGGQQGQAGQGGQGQQGGDQQGQGQQALMPGGQGGNAQLELPGMGQRQGQGQQGSGPGSVGPGAGTGHDPQMLDEPSQVASTRRNIRVQGEESQGPSRSEVILSAADRGFANRSYRDVYTDYESHAEEVLETDEIPPGYRFYVRRYFQLIRPRDGE